ncbi:hypothetical protein KKE19_04125 [Patescibacteria group bacterium]|nr:hypothetical protein [Patescibacteria group bacterium]MBU4578663.1 hypothetical protein [Patescibacteria group bacterium]MCG2701797.1 hypothetical protein [Candidatus Parcubacteria bacterium]
MIGIFNREEVVIENSFLTKFKSEINCFNKLLGVYTAFLEATSNKIKDNEYPNWTILMLLSQTVSLMENGIKLLATGYLRSSEIMIRVCAEAIILSTYFKEFPDFEIEYRTTNYREFFRNHSIDNMLKKVEEDGTIFIKDKDKAKQVKWNKIVFTNLFKESSRFVHNNSDLIYDLSKNNSNQSGDIQLIMGPQNYSDEILSVGMRRLFNTLLFSLVVLGVSLNIVPDENEKEIMTQASAITEILLKK